MRTQIYATLSQWFPDAFSDFVLKDPSFVDYETLRHFAEYTKGLVLGDSDKMASPFKIINLLYVKGSLYQQNAIENDFLKPIAAGLTSVSLKLYLDLMPDALKPVFIKTIVEN